MRQQPAHHTPQKKGKGYLCSGKKYSVKNRVEKNTLATKLSHKILYSTVASQARPAQTLALHDPARNLDKVTRVAKRPKSVEIVHFCKYA